MAKGLTATVRQLYAAGRLDGFWEAGLAPWDAAAGIILVREAGGFVTEIGGGRDPLYRGTILAANDHLHRPLSELLAAPYADTRAQRPEPSDVSR